MLPTTITGVMMKTDIERDRLLLRVEEAAEMCGISRAKAYELVVSGQWPSVQIGRSRRVPLEKLKACLAAQVAGGC
jgi:excisionase family DNA binding protein